MYSPASTRYDSMPYRRCGNSGLLLPAVSLGLWHNFGDTGDYSNMKKLLHTAFDLGITHFDLGNAISESFCMKTSRPTGMS